VRSTIKKLFNRIGYDIQHLPTESIVRKNLELLKNHEIDVIFDVGANTGQFAMKMRKLGYKGRIVSFEPLPDAFAQLAKNASADPLWETVNIAVGNKNGDFPLHISRNSYSSSILDILPRHVESAPDSVYIDQVIVPVRRIDDIIVQYYHQGDKLLIKIDTQGFEQHVVEGCSHSLDKIKGFQMELSLFPLYKGETLMQEMVDILRNYGYRLLLLEPGHQDYTTGEILQVEGVFYR
jgi:FkbM family methyltransferase